MLSKKALKKTLIVISCLVAFVVFLAVVLTPLVWMRQASVKPLDRETLAGLGITALDKAGSSRASSIPAGAAGTDASKDTNTTESLASGAKSRTSLHLARPATVADIRLGYNNSSVLERAFTRIVFSTMKRVEAVVWLVKPNSAGPLAAEIGDDAFHRGDFKTARNYLREALRTGEKTYWRDWVCADLAWLEEDPEVATALLQESCASGNVNFLRDAMELSVLTNSDDLADYYFRRWSDAAGTEETAQWLKQDSPYPAIQAWKKRHAPNLPIKEKSNP